jgi:NodT family efflux transporter outer membrane factor (OMF) lipoprotein
MNIVGDKMRAMRYGLGQAALLAGLLAGCTVGPRYVPPKPALPAHWAGPRVGGSAGAANSAAAPVQGTALPGETLPPLSQLQEQPVQLTRWWSAFHDATLDALMTRALTANLDLRVAVVRTDEALVQRDINLAGRWPSLSANASYDYERLSESTPEGALLGGAGKISIPGVGQLDIPNPYNQYQLGLAASWELDLFGRLRRTAEASNATLQVSVEDQRAVQVSLLAQVAQSYLQLRSAQAREAIAQQDLASAQDLLQLTRQRYMAGLATELDVRNAAAQASQTQAALPPLELAATQAMHQLAVLLGAEPESLRAQLQGPAVIPAVPAIVPIGLPAQLARRRPDIREAEASLHAATAQIGVAVANLYPRLTLSANGGFQSETLGSLLGWSSLFGSVGPALDVPLFDRGSWKSVRLYDLRAREAALRYQSTVLQALREAEDAATAYQEDQRQRQWLTDTVAQNRAALALARQRYQGGVTDFIDVLDTQRTLQQNEQSLAISTAAVSLDLVGLYRALGGGWQATAAQGG